MKLHPICCAAAWAAALLTPAALAAKPPATPAPAAATPAPVTPATPAPATPAPEPAKIFAPTDLEPLRAAAGQTVTIEGMVMGNGESKSGTVRYLNFSKNFRESVALVFFANKGGEEFTAEKLGGWVGKKVRATGKVGEHNGTLQIEIEKWDQVKEAE